MKKYLFYSLTLFTCIGIRAQSHNENISDKFLVYYNAETPDSLFAMYSPEFKEKLPIEKTRAVLSGLHVQFGELRSLSLLKQDSGFNVYKATFSHQTLSLLLAVSDDNQIEGFRLVPYDAALFPDDKKNRN